MLIVTVETLRSSEIRLLRICSNVATTSASFDSPSNEPNGPRLYSNRAQACRMARRMRRSWSRGTLLSRAGKDDTLDTRNAKSSHRIAWATDKHLACIHRRGPEHHGRRRDITWARQAAMGSPRYFCSQHGFCSSRPHLIKWKNLVSDEEDGHTTHEHGREVARARTARKARRRATKVGLRHGRQRRRVHVVGCARGPNHEARLRSMLP